MMATAASAQHLFFEVRHRGKRWNQGVPPTIRSTLGAIIFGVLFPSPRSGWRGMNRAIRRREAGSHSGDCTRPGAVVVFPATEGTVRAQSISESRNRHRFFEGKTQRDVRIHIQALRNASGAMQGIFRDDTTIDSHVKPNMVSR